MRFKKGQPLSTVKWEHTFATICTEEDTNRIYAFALTDRKRPQVFDFAMDSDGLESLANIVRSEDVISVIVGKPVRYSVESVVNMNAGGVLIENRLPIAITDANGQ